MSGGNDPPHDDPDAPLLPASATENDLREAIGSKPIAEPAAYGAEPPPVGEYPLYTPTTQEPSYAAPPTVFVAPQDPGPTPSYAQPSFAPPELPPSPPPPPSLAPEKKKKKPKKVKAAAADGDRDDDGTGEPRSRKGIVAGVLSLLVGLVIATFIFLGRANSDHYSITCEPEQIIAEQGRSFPPWGTRALAGVEYKPIAIPPQAECKPRDTDNPDELTAWYLDLLVDQASTLLTAREVTKVDLAEQQLKQALLLARSPDKRDQRKEIERLLGDVDYWRALATLRDAGAKLGDAAKQFETAAAQRPRHVSDASAWAAYIRKVADELRIGPAGAHESAFPPPTPATIPGERPPAPPGVALPVEPPPTPVAPPVATPDAGVPTGGVLL